MKERISCFDIDGTLSKGLLFVPLVNSEHENGYLDRQAFAQINELLIAFKSGKLEYEDAVEKLLQAHAKGLRDEDYQNLTTHAETFLKLHRKELFHKFGTEVVKILKNEHRLFVATAEPQYVAEAVTNMYGFDGYISSLYTEANGRLTGSVKRSLAHRTAKASLFDGYDIAYAFGDSEGDIDMLCRATYAYAISPSKGLEATAIERGWKVFNGDNTKDIVESIKKTRA